MIGIIFFLSSILLLRMSRIAKERNVQEHQVLLTKDPLKQKQFTFFFITDVHRRKIDNKLLKKIKSFNKNLDFVIIGGDFAERNVPLERVEHNIKKLQSLGPVYFVWGNNDREVGEEAMREIIARYGGTILDNENKVIPKHSAWGICGTDDPSWKKVNLDKTLNQIERYQYVLFVSHQPVVWKRVEPLFKPTLMLSGHTHGGQIRLGKLGIGEKGVFTWLGDRGKLISNGYGTTSIPLRLGAHPESHLMTVYYSDM